MFQHTAARRRLHVVNVISNLLGEVSTHSRAEAAATYCVFIKGYYNVSTHSRAEAAALLGIYQ